MPDANALSSAGAVQTIGGRPASFASERIASIATCICSWPNITAPSMTSSDSRSACDSTMSTASCVPATTRSSFDCSQLRGGRIQQILTVLVADARGGDRAHERQAREHERRRGAEQRRDVGIDLRVHRQHGRDDLHVAPVACGEQRANRSIDEARGQRLLLARPAFALEEAAGDLAGRVGLLLIVDGQREEVASCDVLLVADGRHEDDGVRHVDEHGAVGLPRDDAGFDRDVMGAVLEGSASFHVGFLGEK